MVVDNPLETFSPFKIVEYHSIFYRYSIEYPMDIHSLDFSFLVFYSFPYVFYLVSFLLSSFMYKYIGHVSYSSFNV